MSDLIAVICHNHAYMVNLECGLGGITPSDRLLRYLHVTFDVVGDTDLAVFIVSLIHDIRIHHLLG